MNYAILRGRDARFFALISSSVTERSSAWKTKTPGVWGWLLTRIMSTHTPHALPKFLSPQGSERKHPPRIPVCSLAMRLVVQTGYWIHENQVQEHFLLAVSSSGFDTLLKSMDMSCNHRPAATVLVPTSGVESC